MLIKNVERANLIKLVLLVLKNVGCDPGDAIDINKKITPEVKVAVDFFFRLAENGNLSQTQINLTIAALKAAGCMHHDAKLMGKLGDALRKGFSDFLAIR